MAVNENRRAILFHDGFPLNNKDKIALIMEKMGTFQKIMLRNRGYIKVYKKIISDELGGKLPLYVFLCEKHGLQMGHPSGYNEILLCEECLKENINL
jgi:hypothetical protein